MLQIKKNNPWNPGYSLDQLTEDQRAALDKRGIVRKSYTPSPKDLSFGGFAVPKRIKNEIEGAAKVSLGLPRGHVDGIYPDVFSGKLIGMGDTAQAQPNVTKTYGPKVANIIVAGLRKVEPENRSQALRVLLDKMDPKLNGKVIATQKKLLKQGLSVEASLEKALAGHLNEGFVNQIISMGRGSKKSLKGYAGIGCTSCAPQAVGGVWDWTKKAAKDTFDFVKDAGKKIGTVSCDILNHPATGVVVAGAAASQGAPPQVGMMGTELARSLCRNPDGSQMTQAQIQALIQQKARQEAEDRRRQAQMLTAAAVGGGVLLLVVLARK